VADTPVTRLPEKPAGLFGRIVAGVVLVALFGLLVGLGTWQMQRLHWKEALLSNIAERRAAPPEGLAAIEALAFAGGDIEYRTVKVDGVFLNDRERHFFATFNGQTGFYVYTPLQLADGRAVFVNRGFVPYERKDPASRPGSQPAGHVTIEGLARARLDGRPSWVVPDNDPVKNIFFWKDIVAMTQTAGLSAETTLPFFIDAGANPDPTVLPVGGVTQFDLPNNHLQYALTWYGLAAALVAVSGLFLLRRRADRRSGFDAGKP
jgi:surfeit locus 1 family protein